MAPSMHVIEAQGLSKRYLLREKRLSHGRLTESVAAAVKSLGGLRGDEGAPTRELWALRDVSFSICEGDVVGLLGRNGAGKSTLLKVLSRITEPTEGFAQLEGRLSSLLEVGTGFHPELTGRENVALNGTILGMTRREIRQSFDDIVQFAEIEDFIDIPVKRYSSGMYMRLAFAVAAHSAADILLVDEVLAVGDIAFQRKCLGKMGSVAREGRTIIFVSHNVGSISQLCNRVLWLQGGMVRADGETETVIQAYLAENSGDLPAVTFPQRPACPAQLTGLGVRAKRQDISGEVSCDEPITIEVDLVVRRAVPGLSVAFWLRNQFGVTVLSSDVLHAAPNASDQLVVGEHRFEIDVPPRLLAPARYTLTGAVRSSYEGTVDLREDACSVTVVDYSTATGGSRAGVIGLNLPWRRAVPPQNLGHVERSGRLDA